MFSKSFIKVLLHIVVVLSVLEITSAVPSDYEKDESDQAYESTSQCSSKKRLINPDDLINSLSEEHWEFDKNFSQVIEVEECENEGVSCSENSMMKTSCIQKHVSIQLQVVSKDKKLSDIKTFKIPSSCECAFFRRRIWIWRMNKKWFSLMSYEPVLCLLFLSFGV